MKKQTTINMILSALFIALGVTFPIAFHSLGLAGPIFLPMHIPVLLCGLICGWKYGALVGFTVPLLSSMFTGMPVLFPIGITMCFELCTYGAVAGLLANKKNIFVSLICSMITGRVVSGIANVILLSLSGKGFVLNSFLAGAFITALPGIIVQLILIPVIMMALKKAKILNKVMTA